VYGVQIEKCDCVCTTVDQCMS